MEAHLSSDHTNPKKVAAAWQRIQHALKITLLTHHKPDGDGISACAALSSILTKMGKQIETIYPTESEVDIKRHGANLYIARHNQIPDLIIACDTSNKARLYFPPQFADIDLINIDHHVSNSITGLYNFVDVNASSACELVYELLLSWDKTVIDTFVAEALLYGILYDTQVFRTQNTTPRTLLVTAELIERGANLYEIKNELLAHKNPQIIKLWAKLLDSINIDTDKQVAWAIVTQEDMKTLGVKPATLAGFNNFLAEIAEIDVTILLYEMSDGKTKVSLRSKKTDVNKLAATFGGGGHKYASGISSDQPIGLLAQQLIDQL